MTTGCAGSDFVACWKAALINGHHVCNHCPAILESSKVRICALPGQDPLLLLERSLL